MPSTQIQVTRDQLAEFLPNERLIKAFEELMYVAGTTLPTEITEIIQILQEVSIETGSNAAQAALAISLLADVNERLALLSLAPPVSEVNRTEVDLLLLAPTNDPQGEFNIPFGTTAQYWRGDKTWQDFMTAVRATVLTGLSTATNAVITAADTVLSAFGKLQKQFSDHFAGTAEHGATGAVVGTTNSQTLTNKTLTTPIIAQISNTGTLTLPTSTDTLVGKATTDTFTNKTYDTAGTGNSFSINGTAITAVTGSGSVVLATSPTLVTPALGTPSALVGTNITGTASAFTSGNVAVSTSVKMGYVTGSGGTVTQLTSKATAVTLNTPTGQITTNNSALAGGGLVSFSMTNSFITATSLVIAHAGDNGGNYRVEIVYVNAGNCGILITNLTGGSLSDALKINFAVIGGATS